MPETAAMRPEAQRADPTAGTVGQTQSDDITRKAISGPELSYLEMTVNNWRSNRQRLMQTYKTFLENVKVQQKSTMNSAIQTYEVGNLDRKGNKERVQYFLEISDWYNNQSSALDRDLSGCLRRIQEMDRSWQSWADGLATSLQDARGSEGLMLSGTGPLSEAYSDALRACPISVSFEGGVPARPKLGESSYLGPFGFVASWLLRTESLPLALITGLLGFGLLGSACSTFIRERIKKKDGSPLDSESGRDAGGAVRDLTGIVIRGLSAAVVVFLAVEGGLAIFAAGGSEPNPYVLLLTCLVAAVFSETIWEWAQRELTSRFAGEAGDVKEHVILEQQVETNVIRHREESIVESDAEAGDPANEHNV